MIAIRAFSPEDTTAGHNLLAQLGYEMSGEEFAKRIAAVTASDAHCLLVAELGDKVVGIIHVYARPALDKPPQAIVQALVVDANHRRSHVGDALMRVAEEWTRKRGYASIALHTSIAREDAHKFYSRLGYRPIGTSHLLVKNF